MNWDSAIEHIVNALRADVELQTLLGADYLNRIKRSGDGSEAVPAVTYALVANPLYENVEGLDVQFDIFANKANGRGAYSVAVAIEKRIRVVLHRDTVNVVDGMKMWSEATDARDHENPNEGTVQRSVDFTFTFAKNAA